MSQVDFYILSDPGADAAQRQACLLVNDGWPDAPMYIHTASVSELAAFDRLLWTWRQDSFIPHETVRDPAITDAPVLLGSGEIPRLPCPVLINLSGRMPPDCDQFQRIIEIVPVQADLRAAGRARFKAYRDQGHALQTHNL